MKRLVFVIVSGLPSGLLAARAFGPLTVKGGVAFIAAIITGYVWGITAPAFMHKFEMK